MKKVIGWALVGVGVVAVGYLAWFFYYCTTFFYPWYDFIPFFITYPWLYPTWVNLYIPLIAGVLLLVFGIRHLRHTTKEKV